MIWQLNISQVISETKIRKLPEIFHLYHLISCQDLVNTMPVEGDPSLRRSITGSVL
jgi:hypothetical protein